MSDQQETAYQPSPSESIAEHVRRYEETGDVYASPIPGQPTVILTTVGRKSGAVRKTPLVRVEHEGVYAIVASQGGAPKHPAWFFNLMEQPRIRLQDGPLIKDMVGRVASPAEKAIWWERAVEIWPDYDGYQASTEREIPVVLLESAPAVEGEA